MFYVVTGILKNKNLQQENIELAGGHGEINSECLDSSFDPNTVQKELDHGDFIQKPQPYTGPSYIDLPFIDDSEGDNSLAIHIVDTTSYTSQGDTLASAMSESFHSNYNSQDESPMVKKGFKCAEAVLQTLLDHYKTLNACGVNFTWLGIHKFYRVALVACYTYITEPLQRLWIVTALLVFLAVLNTVVKPYKDNRANLTSILSYSANICIAIINLSKTMLTVRQTAPWRRHWFGISVSVRTFC